MKNAASTVLFWRYGRCPIDRSARLHLNRVPAVIARGKRPVPFRTRKLSLSAPMVLPWRRGGRVGRRRTYSMNEGYPPSSRVALVALCGHDSIGVHPAKEQDGGKARGRLGRTPAELGRIA